jgi:hypothetical protein
MINRSLHWIVLAAITTLAAATAQSADQSVSFATGGYANQLRTAEMMNKIDANKDGMVSRNEWGGYQDKLFSMMDENDSDSLDAQEFMRANSRDVASFATGGFANALRTQEMLAKIDTDRDGQITRAEFTMHQSKVFDMMDTGGKGMLDKTAFFGRGGR